MTERIHIEESGEWTGSVWRRKDNPDSDTGYFWSLSYNGDVRQAAEQTPDGDCSPPNLIPDSAYYRSEDEAKRALQERLQQVVSR
jgi:hypothetical protein